MLLKGKTAMDFSIIGEIGLDNLCQIMVVVIKTITIPPLIYPSFPRISFTSE
jgi:hypothetical protein